MKPNSARPNRYEHRLVLVLAALFIAGGPAAALGQPAVSEFPVQTGSSLRAALLYDTPTRVDETTAHPPEDPWIAFDKVEHFTFGFLFTLGGQYVFVNKGGLTENESLPLAIGVAASAAIAKELYDRRYGSGYFSHRDLVADAAGIAVAVVLILL